MKLVKVIDQAVTLVVVPPLYNVSMLPQIGDYANPHIIRTTPCAKKDGKFYDLRSGKEVFKDENTLEWNNLGGSCFCYADGYELLLSQRFEDKKLLVFELNPNRVSPEVQMNHVMLRPVINRTKSH